VRDSLQNLRDCRSLRQHIGDCVDRNPESLYTGAPRIIFGTDSTMRVASDKRRSPVRLFARRFDWTEITLLEMASRRSQRFCSTARPPGGARPTERSHPVASIRSRPACDLESNRLTKMPFSTCLGRIQLYSDRLVHRREGRPVIADTWEGGISHRSVIAAFISIILPKAGRVFGGGGRFHRWPAFQGMNRARQLAVNSMRYHADGAALMPAYFTHSPNQSHYKLGHSNHPSTNRLEIGRRC